MGINIGGNVSNSVISVNGKTVNIPSGTSVSVINGKIIVDGKEWKEGEFSSALPVIVKIEGDVKDLDVTGSAEITGNCDTVVAQGSVQVGGNVTNEVKASGSVQCGNIGGDVKAGGSVVAGKIGGNVKAGGSVVGS